MANPEEDIYNGEGDSITRAYGPGAPDILVGPRNYQTQYHAAIVQLNGDPFGALPDEIDSRWEGAVG